MRCVDGASERLNQLRMEAADSRLTVGVKYRDLVSERRPRTPIYSDYLSRSGIPVYTLTTHH